MNAFETIEYKGLGAFFWEKNKKTGKWKDGIP